MKVKVLFFASCSDIVGCKEAEKEITSEGYCILKSIPLEDHELPKVSISSDFIMLLSKYSVMFVYLFSSWYIFFLVFYY